jgi:hypothetical protein
LNHDKNKILGLCVYDLQLRDRQTHNIRNSRSKSQI